MGISRILGILLLLVVFAAEAACAGQANVFVYHRFNDSRYPSTNISQENFLSHLQLLRSHDFSVLTLGEIVRSLQEGIPLPERCAAITVDDAYRSFMTDGWPLLKQFGYRATLFVSTDSAGQGEYLGWEDLKTLAAEGVEIGNHSAAHPYLLDYFDRPDWAERVTADLVRSREAFTKHLGYSPELFAYPYGEYSPELVKLVRQAGFVAAFAQQSGVIAPGQDLFSLPRFPMGAGFVSPDEFRSKLFMRHLPVVVEGPQSPVITGSNPPVLRFSVKGAPGAYSNLQCYVPGQDHCEITEVDLKKGVYEVRSEQPIRGRRSKYTVTASDQGGRQWFWFSQLWVSARSGPVPDNPVPR